MQGPISLITQPCAKQELKQLHTKSSYQLANCKFSLWNNPTILLEILLWSKFALFFIRWRKKNHKFLIYLISPEHSHTFCLAHCQYKLLNTPESRNEWHYHPFTSSPIQMYLQLGFSCLDSKFQFSNLIPFKSVRAKDLFQHFVLGAGPPSIICSTYWYDSSWSLPCAAVLSSVAKQLYSLLLGSCYLFYSLAIDPTID